MGALQTKVQVLENELKKEVARNEQLTSVMVNMQKCLNQIDADKRVTNVVINGLSEEVMTTNDDTDLVEDNAKVKYLLHNIGIIDIDAEIDAFEYNRIGIPDARKKRLLKVNVRNKETRDKICQETKKIKLLPAPWKSVYIDKDVHPVCLKENQRQEENARYKENPGLEHDTGRVNSTMVY